MAEERLDDSADGTVGDVFQALAEHYAELWNDLHDAGMEPSDVGMAKVAAELDEGSWAVHHDDDTGKWVAVEVNDDEPAEGERLSYARAVSGGGKAPRVKGKSGVFTDKRGHKYKLQNGRRVPMGDGKAAAPAKPSAKTDPEKPAAKAAGGAPKKTPPSTTTKTPATEKAAKKPAVPYAEQVKAKKNVNGNPPAKGTLAKAVSKAEEVTDAVADKVEAVADFLNTPISEVPARLRDMFRRSPDDPAAVMKEAEKAKTRVEAAINAGLSSPTDEKKVEKIVADNQQTLMAKLGGLAAGVAVRTARVVGGLGLIGIGAGLGAMGGVAAATNPAFLAIGLFDGILNESVELMSRGAGLVSGKSDDDGEVAKPKKYARDATDDDTPASDADAEPESFGEALPMSVIRKLAVDYYTGLIEDLQAEFGGGAGGSSKATEPTLFDGAEVEQ